MPVSLMFLSLTDAAGTTVAGDSEDGDYAGLIEIDTFRWALDEAPVGPAPTGGEATTRVIPQQLLFTKTPDRATPRLLKALANGEICRQADFILTERSTLEPFHLVVTLADARVTGYELDATDEDSAVTLEESWAMTYKSIQFLYTYDGTHEVTLDRPPGADLADGPDPLEVGGGRPGDQLAERFKEMSRSDQVRFLELSKLQVTPPARGGSSKRT